MNYEQHKHMNNINQLIDLKIQSPLHNWNFMLSFKI